MTGAKRWKTHLQEHHHNKNGSIRCSMSLCLEIPLFLLCLSNSYSFFKAPSYCTSAVKSFQSSWGIISLPLWPYISYYTVISVQTLCKLLVGLSLQKNVGPLRVRTFVLWLESSAYLVGILEMLSIIRMFLYSVYLYFCLYLQLFIMKAIGPPRFQKR